MNPRLISLYSPSMGAGKSTLANALNAFGFRTVKFAGGLKVMLRSLLDLRGVDENSIDRMIDGDLKEVPSDFLNGRTPRHAMQTLGTEWGRDLMAANLWVSTAADRIASLMRQGHSIVVDDMRFSNEFETIRALGSVTVKIVRPNAKNVTGHVSEGALNGQDFDLTLVNDAPTAGDFVGGALTALHNLLVERELA